MAKIGRPASVFLLLLCGLAGRGATAATGYYLVNVYSDPGQLTLDYKYWNAKTPGSPPFGSPELGVGVGVNARWYTEVYGVAAQTAAQGTSFTSMNWQNDVLLTQGEYPFDLAIHTNIEQYRAREGYGFEWGPALQTEWWRTQFNVNLFFQRDYRVNQGGPTQLAYQWQIRQHWRTLLDFGLQGFGELGQWDHWASRQDQSHRIGPALFGTLRAGGQFLKYEAAYLVGTNSTRSAHTFTMRLQLGF
jgi:hypothetical protein